jgi:hypothetical protein
MVVPNLRTALVAVAVLSLAGCGGEVDPGQPVATTRATPVDLVARCGAAEFPPGTVEVAGTALDPSARAAVDALARYEEEGGSFATGYAWMVASMDDASLVLIGVGEDGGYADASFEVDGDGWRPVGWGTCHLETAIARPGYATGHWILDPSVEPDPTSSALSVWVMERSCAGGEVPDERDVEPIVESSPDSITITVVIQTVEGAATCQSNPWYATTFDLGEPLRDRVLFDGFVRPGLARPWPPTETSLGTLGDDE